MSKQKSVDATRRELLTRMQTEGVIVAYETALEICRDAKAPAPARATSMTALFRVAGYMNPGNSDVLEKEPHEMTGEELDYAVAQLLKREKALARVVNGEADETGVFD